MVLLLVRSILDIFFANKINHQQNDCIFSQLRESNVPQKYADGSEHQDFSLNLLAPMLWVMDSCLDMTRVMISKAVTF